MRLLRLPFFGALVALAGTAPAWADPPAKEQPEPTEVSYYRHVRPIFQQHCQGCHQPAKSQGGFIMTTYPDLLKTGETGQPGVVPGQPDASLVVKQITPQNGKAPAMPKGGDSLLDHDVNLVKKWIAQGAKDDTPPSARDIVDVGHPPAYVLPPVITSVDYS